MSAPARAASGSAPRLRFRRTPKPSDVAAVRRLAKRAGVFSRKEQAVAVELIEERLRSGARSGYFFAFAELDGVPVGYAAWGPVPMTAATYDLYWIAVDPRCRGAGVGRRLLELAERAVRERAGRHVYIETSSRDAYERTRKFYRRAGYRQAARFVDFYADGDHKVVFCKKLPSQPDVP